MQSMSQVTPIAAVPSAIDLIRGYATSRFGVSWRPGALGDHAAAHLRAASLTAGRLVFGVSSA